MNKEIKQKWVNALRSGKYEQGKNRLRDANNKYCCLGVLCEIADLEYEALSGRYYYGEGEDRLGSDADLPGPFAATVNVTMSDEAVLIKMNDDLDKTFNEIAEYIERNL